MNGLSQTPISFYRLNDTPLDISLTFDSILLAKKYVKGLDISKGTPYDGQIISVNNICGCSKIYATFIIRKNNNKYNMELNKVYRKDTKEVFDNIAEHIIDVSNNKMLLVYSNIPSLDCFKTSIDLLFSDRQYAYSILGLLGLFYNNSNKIIGKIYSANRDTGVITVIEDNISQSINILRYKEFVTAAISNSEAGTDGLYISDNVLKYNTTALSNTSIDTNSNNQIEIYINLNEYLDRDEVI